MGNYCCNSRPIEIESNLMGPASPKETKIILQTEREEIPVNEQGNTVSQDSPEFADETYSLMHSPLNRSKLSGSENVHLQVLQKHKSAYNSQPPKDKEKVQIIKLESNYSSVRNIK